MRRFLPILILLLVLSAALYAIFAGYGNNGGGAGSATNGSQTDAPVQDVAALRTEFSQGMMRALVFERELKPAPQNQFTGPDGRVFSMASFKGEVLLVNFWATWCAPCRHEMPSLNRLQAERGGDDFRVVTINVDRGDGAKADKFMAEVGADLLTVYKEPSNRMAAAYRVNAMPTTFLINKDGQILAKLLGATEWNSPEAHRLLDWALAGSPAP